MHHPFVPAMLLLFAPAVLLTWRLDLSSRRSGRAFLGVLAAAIAIWSIAHGGMDYDHLKTVKMLLAAATAAVLAAVGSGTILRHRRDRVLTLGGLAAAAWLVHFNFLGFHGVGQTREFVHLHDVAHYYLGSKYFRELAHADLYAAMLRAEAERFGISAIPVEVRNLRDNSLVDARVALRDSDVVKAGFTPTRWEDFGDDVAWFRDAMRGQYHKVLRDFGYNPTPLWTAIGGSLANLVPAGNDTAIRALALIDPVLELVMFAAIAWAFGIEVMLVSMIYFCLLFGASFGWLGGSVLRHLWLTALIGCACALHKGRPIAAGGLLALSTLLRVFPFFFVLGPLARLLHDRMAGRASPQLFRFIVAFAVVGVVLFATSAAAPRGLDGWLYFQSNMQRHVQNIAFNTIGLTHLLDTALTALPFVDDAHVDKVVIHRAQLFTVVPLVLFWVWRRAGRGSTLDALALGLVPIFAALDLACYYYVALLLLVFVLRDRPLDLSLLLLAEAASYALRLFEDDEATVFLYRNLTVAFLLAFTFLRDRGPTAATSRRAPVPDAAPARLEA